MNTTRNINIRGKGDFHLSRTIDGLPLMGIVGGSDLFDLENIGRIDVYRGPVPSDKGLGLSNAAGVINQLTLRPQDRAGFTARQAFGTDSFYKTFVRIDTGLNPETATKAFLSGSLRDTGGNRWRRRHLRQISGVSPLMRTVGLISRTGRALQRSTTSASTVRTFRSRKNLAQPS